MPKHGKRYRSLRDKVDAAKVYSSDEAAALVKELATAKFDETIEAHVRLGIDPRKSDQNVRGTVALPHGTGRTVRVPRLPKGKGSATPRPPVRTTSAATSLWGGFREGGSSSTRSSRRPT